MSEDDDKKLPAIQNRLIGAAVEIDQDDPLRIVGSGNDSGTIFSLKTFD